ncbi:GAF domain-containing protein [Massilia sp. ZL223]|uniref:hybrid sensor histidine kinase/response regulator n=1 Tax=Massilia sp. ZL223 TaxID=2824904 RepID=UPI001B8389E4|nr:GAF domain-containing protein [Massilia sp. ZL223]MBQ5963975.1 GAF domain-containing protein [Massilia sp. ZL223]
MNNDSSFLTVAVGGMTLPDHPQGRDWPTIPLGEPDAWPEGPRALAELITASRFPMLMALGPELRLFYNAAYAELLGDKHPAAQGAPFPQVRPELWPRLESAFRSAQAGDSTQLDHALMEFERNGKRERRYFRSSFAPVRHAGVVAGVYCVLSDTTSDVLSEHRHAFHLKLSETLGGLVDAVHIMEAASAMTGETLGVARVGYGEIDPQGRTITVDRDWTDGSIASLAGQSRALESFGPAIIEQLQAGRTLRLDDIALDERAAPYAAGYASIGARSMIIVPIMEEGRLAAIFYLHEKSARHWTDQELAMAEDVARHTREVVRRSRVEESLRDETRILEMVNRTGQVLASTLDLRTVLQTVTDAGTELTGARFGACFYGDDGEPMHLHALSGVACDQLGHPSAGGVFAPVLAIDGPVRCDDITLDPRHAGIEAGHLEVRSFLAMPVVSHSGKLLGGLFFGHPEPGMFTERSERIVAGIAAQAAVAMDNARLYQLSQKSAQERDILLQSERAARVKAERLSHTKDEFLAMLAHELRNPLAPISSSASLLSMQFADEPRICQTSTIISRQVRHMSRLIDDLLDVSRVTRGLVKLKLGLVDFREVVSGALDQTRPLVLEKAHQVTVQMPEEPVYVKGDHTRLVQSVANILNNAAKYTQKAGRIALTLQADEGGMRLEVRDNGSGMPAELVPNVFDLFTQGARTLARSQGGLGLGLALVKKLVELHEGDVRAHSDGVGLGSTFTLTLPCVLAAADGEYAPRPDPIVGAGARPERKLRLIVVDDNTDAADSLAMLLSVQGYAASVEYDAASAIERARRERPDMMLIDIGLPDMDGYQLAERLRAQPETAHTVLVAITGYGQPKDRERVIAAGIGHHLVKPVDMTALGRILESGAGMIGVPSLKG